MRPGPLAPAFVRRMAPLAALAAVFVGVVLPATYRYLALHQRQGEARIWAQSLATELASRAAFRPRLWAFDGSLLAQVTAPAMGPAVRAWVRVDVPQLEGVFEAGRTRTPSDVVAYAPVKVGGVSVGRVAVALDALPVRRTAATLWLLLGGGGALLGLALLGLPYRTVRWGDKRNHALWDALIDANTQLEARVMERTAELRAREAALKALGARLLQVQEEERARISRDLHDDLGQVLTGLRLRLTALAQSVAPAQKVHVDAALAAVDDGVGQVRRLAHNLRPPELDGLGLPAALTAHAERWAEVAGLSLTLSLAPIEPPAAVAEVLFRVAQEALTNVARHAEARTVWLALAAADDGYCLTVDDDGRGLGAPSTGGGLGLVGARERVDQLGGYLDVEPSPRGGVRLLVWLPQDG